VKAGGWRMEVEGRANVKSMDLVLRKGVAWWFSRVLCTDKCRAVKYHICTSMYGSHRESR